MRLNNLFLPIRCDLMRSFFYFIRCRIGMPHLIQQLQLLIDPSIIPPDIIIPLDHLLHESVVFSHFYRLELVETVRLDDFTAGELLEFLAVFLVVAEG